MGNGMDMKTVSPELLVESGRTVQKPLKAEGQSADKNNAAVKKAAREFEALFTSMMLKSMRGTVGKDTVTGGGNGEEIYRSMLDQEYANLMAANGGIGLAQMIERQLKGTK